MNIELVALNSLSYKLALKLRNEILRKPLGLDIANEDLSDEVNQVHFVALKENVVVGTVSLIPQYTNGVGKLRQMATAEEVRGEGYGIALVQELEKYSKDLGLKLIVLHARHYALGFYEKLNYQITSDVFQEVGMDHFVMGKEL